MKKTIRVIAVLAMLVLALGMTACSQSEQTDSAYVQGKGKLVIGITDFAPMDFQEEGSDEWVGFDADMGKLFAESLGVEAEFVLIEWGQKVSELNGKTIDCVWNGMTLDDEVTSAMETSNAYCLNAQVVVVPSDKAADFQDAESCKALKFAVEDGSAGQKVAEENGFSFVQVADQATALLEVNSGTSDAAIIDLLMADAMIGKGTSYENLTYTAKLNSEEYGVGFRKGSDLAEKLNAFFKEIYDSGKMLDIATQYGVSEESVIAQ